MDIREIKNNMENNEIFYVPKLKETITINRIEKKNGRTWGIGVTSKGKDIRVDIRDIKLKNAEVKTNSPTEFPKEIREECETRENRTFEALRLLGKNSEYIKKILKPEMENAMKKTMMVKYSHSKDATVRTAHYANTALIALKIARGLFPGDEDLAKGIALCALCHDYGQDPFGHDGEEAARKALENFNAGYLSHNTQGAELLLFREYPKLMNAINEEAIIEAEAKSRLGKKNFLKNEEINILKMKKAEIKQNIELGLEPELTKAIENETKENGDLVDEAILLLIMSAGNHNGERGTAQITPDYSLTFDDFMDKIIKTGICKQANNELVPHTIADSIAKLADQISSIPFDMIDGVRAGIEDEIPSDWVLPVSQILKISDAEARERLKGGTKELVNLALEIQDKLIESVVRCSNSRKIDMDLDEWLYGLNNKIGLRTPNLKEHIIYTSTEEEGIILDNLFSDLTERLSSVLLNEKGLFHPKLNSIFRFKANNPYRASMEANLKADYIGDEKLRKFYDYCVETSSEQYNFDKKIVKKKETEYFRNIIVKELKKDDTYVLPRSSRGTMEYAIKVAMMSGIEKVEPDEKGYYSDEKIKIMIENINAFLMSNPIDGIEHLNVTAPKKTYETGNRKYITERKITDDQSIAARMAVGYLCQLNDTDLLDLGKELSCITQEQYNLFFKPYTEHSAKRKGGEGHYTSSAIGTAQDYSDAEKGEK